MSDKSQTTNQHYVPVCYLANFGTDGNKGRGSTVYYLNIVDNKCGISGVESFPKEKGFYDIDALGEYKDAFEKMYTDLEGELSKLLKRLIELVVFDISKRTNETVMLSGVEKSALSAQLSMQFTRTRAFRDWMKGNYNRMKEGFAQFNPPEGTIPEYDDDDFRRLHMSYLMRFDVLHLFANVFESRNWCFLVNHTNIPFFTSDNPVVMKDIEPNSKTPKGVADPQITYFFPVTPWIAILIVHKDILKKDMRYIDIGAEEIIMSYNYRMYTNCTRFLFSNVDFSKIHGFTGEKNEQIR